MNYISDSGARLNGALDPQASVVVYNDKPTGTTPSIPIRPKVQLVTFDRKVYVRDTIVVNDAFRQTLLDEIAHHKFEPGTTLTVAARKIRHVHAYELRLEGYPLVMVADTYEGNGGAIDTSGGPGANGATGATGTKGVSSANNPKPGGPGGDGSAGGQGKPASSITLIARSISNLRLIAQGGAGGKGGAGGTGGEGAKQKIINKPGDPSTIDGTLGGKGGNGNNGGGGNDGAQITVHYFTKPSSFQVSGSGGAGGQRGTGGQPGKSYDVAPVPVPSGQPGRNGPAGKSVAPVQIQHTFDEWWAAARSTGLAAGQWAEHRTRVGEYRWRVENNPEDALVEFDAAIRLSPHAKAHRLRGYIHANQSPIGVAYDHDLMPDFNRYEEVVTDYGPMIQNLTTVATTLLLEASDVPGNRARLEAQLTHLDGLRQADENGVAFAQIGISYAERELDFSDAQIERLKNELESVEEAMKDEETDVFGTLFGIFSALVEIIGAVYTGGATLAALPASIGMIVDAANVLDAQLWDAETNTFQGKNLADWKETQEFKEMVGGLKDLVERSKNFYDKALTVKELFEADVDDELAQRHKELIIQLLELDFQRNQLELKKLQGELALDSAEAIKLTAEQDRKAVEDQINTLTANIALLAGFTRRLMRNAQVYVDLYTKYAFLAARALDLWTLRDQYAPKFSFGLGYLDPDKEAEAFMLADRGSVGSGSKLLELLVAYQETVKNLPRPAHLRDAYEAYTGALNSTPYRKYWNITDPAVLDALRATQETTVRTRLSSIHAGHAELKVTQVYVSLVGATSENETVMVEVEHTGHAENRRKDPATVTTLITSAPPVRSPVAATTDESISPVLGEQQEFWGRSPAALWRLKIDSSRTPGLDLTGLTELQLVIDYQFLPV